MKWFEKINNSECFSPKNNFKKLSIMMYYLELFVSEKIFCFVYSPNSMQVNTGVCQQIQSFLQGSLAGYPVPRHGWKAKVNAP